MLDHRQNTDWDRLGQFGPSILDSGHLTQPADFRKQVIVHELLHLRVPNHGKLFKALLRAYLGTRSSRD
jgi:Protein of unknown function DUF45